MQIGTTIRENRATIVAALVVAGLIAALWAVLYGHGTTSSSNRMVALVHDGDGKVHTLPLDRDDTLVVVTSLGTNTVMVRGGAVSMKDADCPNGTCIQHAPMSEPGSQIICLPHELWIEVVPEGSEGGVMDVTLAETDDRVDLMSR